MKKFFIFGQLKLWQKYCETQKANPSLRYLYWEPTLRCNLRCKHCGSSCSPQTIKRDELTTKQIKHAFLTIAKDFNPKRIMISVTGGEALLRKDIFKVMKYASGLGFSWGMVTNGTLITPKTIKEMVWSNMSTVSVSLDGMENNHNWLRNKPCYRNTIRGIKLLTNSGKFKVVDLITCVHPKNLKELNKIYNLCKKLNINSWRIFTIAPVGRAFSNSKLQLNKKQLRYLLDFVKTKRDNKKNKIKVNFCDEGFLGTEYEGEVRDNLFFCWAGINVASILYNGDIGACPILPREHTKQGNIKKDRFSKIWNEEFKLFRNRLWRKVGKCRNCKWWVFCEGNSLHLWNFDEKKLNLCNYQCIN